MPRLALPFLFLLVAVAYANSLGNNFVTDDLGAIVESYPRPFASIFEEGYAFFRHFLYFFLYQLGGPNPVLFRLTNIAFHLGSTLLVYGIAAAVSRRPVALVAASLFAVHPIAAESVTWISGGVYAQYAFFFLLSLFLYIRAAKQPKLLPLSYAAFLLSLLSSEKSLSLFLVFPLYEWVFGNLRAHKIRAFIPAVAAAGFALFYLSFLGERTAFLQTHVGVGGGLYNPLIQIPVAVSSYLSLLFWPKDLSYYHSQTVFTPTEFALRLLALLGLVTLLIVAVRKNRPLFFWLAFFTIALLPTTTPLRIAAVVAERYAYLATVGFCIAISIGFVKIFSATKYKLLYHFLLCVAILTLLARTIVRNLDWQNEERLWFATVKTAPNSANAHDNLGVVYLGRNDLAAALQEFEVATQLNPRLGSAYLHLGMVTHQKGNRNRALTLYTRSLELDPTLWRAYQHLATIYLDQGEFDLAAEALENARTLKTQN